MDSVEAMTPSMWPTHPFILSNTAMTYEKENNEHNPTHDPVLLLSHHLRTATPRWSVDTMPTMSTVKNAHIKPHLAPGYGKIQKVEVTTVYPLWLGQSIWSVDHRKDEAEKKKNQKATC
jgi:hypothetical protein